MAPVRRVVLDVLKPHEPEMVAFGERVGDLDGVDAATVGLVEIDRQVQNVKLAVEGEDLDYDAIQATVEDLGATVHSVDEVACGDHLADHPGMAPLGATWLR